MNNAVIFSQIIGPLFILMWVSMMINRKWYKDIVKEIQSNNLLVLILGIVWFIFGMYILSWLQSFSNSFEIFTGIIAIMIVLKSAFLIITPHIMKSISKSMKPIIKNIHYIGALYLLIWLYVSYISYV